jgi:oligoendopeptidase F
MVIDELQEQTWNIDTLVDGRGETGADALIDDALARAQRLTEHKGKIADLDAEGLAAIVAELAEIRELVGKAMSFAFLSYATDTQDERRGALMQKMEERATEITTLLLFFQLEWTALPDERAEELLAHPGLDIARHYLRVQRRYRDHLLSEPEEKILAEKALTSRNAWVRLFSDLVSAIEVDIDGEKKTLEETLSRLSDHDRDVRKTAASSLTEALKPGVSTRAYIHNMLAQDKAVEDRLRSYQHWLQSFNISQEASDAAVEALVGAVRKRYDLAHRWYGLAAKALKLDKLAHYDRYASFVDDDVEVAWDQAKEIVLDCYNSFSPEAGTWIERFFDERWIDVPANPGKMPGAFCEPTVPSHNPYILLNFTGKRRDVLTLAHELGHGLHAVLANPQGPFHNNTPLTIAETASVFGETIVFNRLLELADSPMSRFSLLASKVEGAIATVYRQVAMNGFEARVHNARRSEGELSVERFGDLWIETQAEMLGDNVELDDDYRLWWSYIPHFVHVPGYVYSYAFGHLLATSVYGIYEQRGESFVPSYLEMLAAGGSRSPEDVAAIGGCDLTDPSFWDAGLKLIERDIDATEAAAKEAGAI